MIRNLIRSKNLLLDGSMGTALQSRKVINNEIPALVSNSDFEQIVTIHKEYLAAGSNIITTNTFSINSEKLGSLSILKETIKNSVNAAKIARNSSDSSLIAYNLGPLGVILEPHGTMTFDRAYQLFAEQVEFAKDEGVDLIIIETFSDLLELKAAVLAVKELSDLPIFATMSFDEDMRTFSGVNPQTMAITLEAYGVDALGVNCSLGPDLLVSIVKEIREFTSLPIIAQPNAGLPKVIEGETFYNLSPELFARQMARLLDSGASILGGCCGTSPSHIESLKDVVDKKEFEKPQVRSITAATSGVKTVVFGDKPIVIGERINPTGKEELQKALALKKYDYIVREAIKQADEGADIIDVNLSVNKLDEKSLFDEITKAIQAVVDLPLQFDSSKPQVFESALRRYSGKPIINSVNGKQSSMNEVFPLAKKYGALVIGLTLDEEGLPKTAEKRLEIAKKIVKEARKHGIEKKNIIIDCLTLTASAQQDQALETLRGIKLIKEELAIKTVLGISNISYGLPNRELVNQVFLIQAIQNGLDSAIVNSGDKNLMNALLVNNVLLGTDNNAKAYITHFSEGSNNVVEKVNDLSYAVHKGLKVTAAEITADLLKQHQPLEIVNDILIPRLNKIGQEYEERKIYLPQLIQAAEAAKASFSVINKALSVFKEVKRDKIVLATVEGDIHDIGKNIVKILLENYSYDVIDLGKDVSPDEILKECKKHNIRLLGLSALMTSTVESMERTISLIREEMPCVKIMVGGAVLTEQYAKEIDADYYSKDAQGAVKIAKSIFK